MRIKMVLGLILVAVLAGAYFFFIGRKEPEGEKIRVGYIPIADCAQLYVAVEKGFFTAEGIETELVSMTGGARILEALGAGSVEIGFSNVVSLILAHDAGLPFVAIGGGPVENEKHQEHAILVRQDSALNAVTDLAGKTIALNTRKNIDELMVTLLLRKHNVDPASVTFLEVPFPRMLAVLASGDIDAAAAIEPFVTLGVETSSAKILTYNYPEIQPETEISTYVTTKRWASQRAEIVNGFRHALARASAYANNNQAEVRTILTKYTRLDHEQARKVVLPAFREAISEKRLNQMIAHVHAMGWINSPFDAREVLTTASGK